MFLTHFTGGGIPVFDIDIEEFWIYFDEAIKLYEIEIKQQKRVILSGIEK